MADLNTVLRRVRRRFTCWWIHGHRDARPASLIGLYEVHQPAIDRDGQPTGCQVCPAEFTGTTDARWSAYVDHVTSLWGRR